MKNLIAGACAIALISCGSVKPDEEKAKPEFPALPPLGAFTSNTTQLQSATNLGGVFDLVSSYANHNTAALTGLPYWGVELIVIGPKLAFQGAASQSLTEVLDDGVLARSFTISHGGASLTGKLTARVLELTTGHVEWKFYVTKTPADSAGCCDNTLWFEGTTQKGSGPNSSKGNFYLHDLTEQEAPVAEQFRQYEYYFDQDNIALYTMKFTNLLEVKHPMGGPYAKDSYVSRRQVGDQIEVSLDKDPSTPELDVISWNPVTNEGSHKKLDGTTVCWDTQKQDIPCPEK